MGALSHTLLNKHNVGNYSKSLLAGGPVSAHTPGVAQHSHTAVQCLEASDWGFPPFWERNGKKKTYRIVTWRRNPTNKNWMEQSDQISGIEWIEPSSCFVSSILASTVFFWIHFHLYVMTLYPNVLHFLGLIALFFFIQKYDIQQDTINVVLWAKLWMNFPAHWHSVHFCSVLLALSVVLLQDASVLTWCRLTLPACLGCLAEHCSLEVVRGLVYGICCTYISLSVPKKTISFQCLIKTNMNLYFLYHVGILWFFSN